MTSYTCSSCGKCSFRVRNRGSIVTCSPCQRAARVRIWKAANPARTAALNAASSKRNPDAKLKYAKSERGRETQRLGQMRYAERNRDRINERARFTYALNRDAAIQKAINRIAHIRRATPKWADTDAISAVYKLARSTTMETGVKHQVDHIIPLRGRTVSGLHVEANLSVITAVENWHKHAKFSNEGNP